GARACLLDADVQPAPRPALFPYTTLFRSIGMVLAVLAGLLEFASAKAFVMVGVVYGLGQVVEGFYLTPRLVGERIGLHPLAVILDRKSTRLNSSHVATSYAVFCLKKKMRRAIQLSRISTPEAITRSLSPFELL